MLRINLKCINFHKKGIWGPFKPPSKSKVPLWLALDLKRRKRCSIVTPDWLSVGECDIPIIKMNFNLV